MRAFALSPDATSVVAALPAKALMRIVRIPLNGRGVPNDLFTVTNDVWHMDVAANGSMLVNLIDRPGEVVRLTSTGAQAARLAHFPQATASKMVVALADGRDVVDMSVSGRMRLMLMESGKAPIPLLKTQGESAAPMTALTGNRIAFAIGPEPRETIAVADTQTGRIAGRISPGKGVVQTRRRVMERRCTSRLEARCGRWRPQAVSRVGSAPATGSPRIHQARSS